DTCHFKGNYPDSCRIDAVLLPEGADATAEDVAWVELLPQSKLQAHHEHYFKSEIAAKGPFSHVRLNIFPDGGVSRLRLWGNIDRA
ncbi:MAG: allantoicase, partial [Bacteroidota bacterium]